MRSRSASGVSAGNMWQCVSIGVPTDTPRFCRSALTTHIDPWCLLYALVVLHNSVGFKEKGLVVNEPLAGLEILNLLYCARHQISRCSLRAEYHLGVLLSDIHTSDRCETSFDQREAFQ